MEYAWLEIRHGGFYAAAAKARYERLAALLGHIDNRPKPGEEPWSAACEQCGGKIIVETIAIRKTVIHTKAWLERIRHEQTAGKSTTPTQERAP